MLYPLPNLALCSHASCFHLSCFSPLLVSSPKQSVFIFERVISEKTKFSNSYSFPASKKIYFWFTVANSVIRKVVIPNNLIIFVESFQIGINFLFGLQNIIGLHHLYLLNLWSHQGFFLLAPSHYLACQ